MMPWHVRNCFRKVAVTERAARAFSGAGYEIAPREYSGSELWYRLGEPLPESQCPLVEIERLDDDDNGEVHLWRHGKMTLAEARAKALELLKGNKFYFGVRVLAVAETSGMVGPHVSFASWTPRAEFFTAYGEEDPIKRPARSFVEVLAPGFEEAYKHYLELHALMIVENDRLEKLYEVIPNTGILAIVTREGDDGHLHGHIFVPDGLNANPAKEWSAGEYTVPRKIKVPLEGGNWFCRDYGRIWPRGGLVSLGEVQYDKANTPRVLDRDNILGRDNAVSVLIRWHNDSEVKRPRQSRYWDLDTVKNEILEVANTAVGQD